MVSTRAMARKEPSATETNKDAELTLRKKPVRKATAKHTKAPASKTKAAEKKPKPLSPSSITQVTTAPSRSTKASEAKQKGGKTATKPAQTKSTTTGRGRTKKTNDNVIERVPMTENPAATGEQPGSVGVPLAVDSEDREDDESLQAAAPTTTPPPPRSSQKRSQSRSAAPRRRKRVYQDESDDEIASHASSDELCGPKTPMRRSSPATQAKFLVSVQRTARQEFDKDPLQSPARRFQGVGIVKATSRTKKPQQRIISNGGGDIFKQLFEHPEASLPSPSKGGCRTPSKRLEDVSAQVVINEERVFATPKAATEVIVRESTLRQRQTAGNYTVLHHPDSLVEHAEIELETDTAGEHEIMDYGDETIAIPDSSEKERSAREILPVPDSDHVIPKARDEDDMTVLIDGDLKIHHCPSPVKAPLAGAQCNALQAFTAASPETLVWECIRDDLIIPVDFHKHLKSPAQHQEDLDAVAGTSEDDVVVDQVEYVFDREEDWAGIPQEGADRVNGIDSLEMDDGGEKRDDTATMGQFIDLAALTEGTGHVLQMNQQQQQDEEQEQDEEKEEQEEAEEKIMKTQKVAIAEAEGSPSISTLLQLPMMTSEDVLGSPSRAIGDAVLELHGLTPDVPHYALSTAAFDARRKSLPALQPRTPIHAGTRPTTSDGATMPKMSTSLGEPFWAISTPVTTAAMPKGTSAESTQSLVAKASIPPRIFTRAEQTPASSAKKSTISTAQRPTASLAGLGQSSPLKQISSPSAKGSPPRSRAHTGKIVPKERYSRLAPPKTAAAPTRFRTPISTPTKRPATAQKASSLRKHVLKNITPRLSRTPCRTPLKPPAMTPGQVRMTPHPKAPLRGLLALVEVFTNEGASASTPFIALLHRLGAKTTKIWKDGITHVIFKDGSPTTLQRVRLTNKDAVEGNSTAIYCVNSRWVTDCDVEGARVGEEDEAYAVDVDEIPRGGKRRRKSMEPTALVNIAGNVVNSRSSLGRASLARSSLDRTPLRMDSPARLARTPAQEMPKIFFADKEDSVDEQSEPATPAWIAAPDQLVQQTAPINKVQRLDLQAERGRAFARDRRQTLWTGMA